MYLLSDLLKWISLLYVFLENYLLDQLPILQLLPCLPMGLTGKYNRVSSVTNVLAVPIEALVLLFKTKMRLINVAIVAFSVVLICGKGGIFDLMLIMKLSDFLSARQ